jgi:hypothetical protein
MPLSGVAALSTWPVLASCSIVCFTCPLYMCIMIYLCTHTPASQLVLLDNRRLAGVYYKHDARPRFYYAAGI